MSAVSSVLDITSGTSPFVVKSTPGRLHSVIFSSASGSTDVVIYDANSAAGAVAANQVGYVVGAVGGASMVFDWPMLNGIVVVVNGTGQAAVSFD